MRRAVPSGPDPPVIFENQEACHTGIRVWQVFCAGARRGGPVDPAGEKSCGYLWNVSIDMSIYR